MIIPGAVAAQPIYRQPTSYPIPPNLAFSNRVVYWFAADHGTYVDVDGRTPCQPGEQVALWKNIGSADEHAKQTTPARRPRWFAEGQNGRPYILCNGDQRQHFEDLLYYRIKNGILTHDNWLDYAMVWALRNPDNGKVKPILGNPGSGKGSVYINVSGQVRYYKNQWLTAPFKDTDTHALVASHNGLCSQRHTWESGTFSASPCTNPASSPVTKGEFLRYTFGGEDWYWDGELYELVIFNSTGSMNLAQQATWMEYFKTKYAL